MSMESDRSWRVFIFVFFRFDSCLLRMAGTIRKVNGHSLVYSDESCDAFHRSGSESASSSASFSYEIDDGTIEFDLRNNSAAEGIVALTDAPPTPSEVATLLQSAPLPAKTVPLRSVCSTKPATPSASPRPEACLHRKDPSKLAQLVDELLDSPKPVSRDATTGIIFPVLRTIPPRGVRGRVGQIRSSPRPIPKPRPPDTWKCPDSWIPNHQCDSFCWETLRLSI